MKDVWIICSGKGIDHRHASQIPICLLPYSLRGFGTLLFVTPDDAWLISLPTRARLPAGSNFICHRRHRTDPRTKHPRMQVTTTDFSFHNVLV